MLAQGRGTVERNVFLVIVFLYPPNAASWSQISRLPAKRGFDLGSVRSSDGVVRVGDANGLVRRPAACSGQLRIHMNGAGASGYRSGGSFLSNETDESLEDQGLNPAIESGEGFFAKQTLDALDWPLLLTHLVGECPLLPPT